MQRNGWPTGCPAPMGTSIKHESLEWLHHLIRRTDSPDLLAAMVDTFPRQTVALRECACAAQERMVAFHRQDTSDDPITMTWLAGGLNNLAAFLSELGRREAALHAGSCPGAEALVELEQAPAHPDNQGDVRKQLTKLLTENPALADELRALLAQTAPAGDALTQTVTGNSNKVVGQITGHGNSVSIR